MRFVPLMIAVGACGTNSAPPIPVEVPGQPVLMTLKLGTGAWKPVDGVYDATAHSTTYQVDVTNDFELVGACTRPNGTFVVSEIFGTIDDAAVTLGAWQVPDCLKSTNGIPAPPTDETVNVTGVADSNAIVLTDYGGHNATAGQEFSFTTWSGRHDLICISGPLMFVEHDVDLTTSKDLGSLDVGTQGMPLLSGAIDPGGDLDEAPSIQTSLKTSHGSYYYWQDKDPGYVVFVPPEELGPSDQETLTISLYGETGGWRNASATVVGASVPDFSFLPRLAPVATTSDGFGVTLPVVGDFYTSALLRASAKNSLQTVAASKLWLDRHAADQLELDTNVDGYDPAWTLSSPLLLFWVERWNPGLVLRTGTTPTP